MTAKLATYDSVPAKVRAYDESMEMFTAAQSDPNMGDLHLDRLDLDDVLAACWAKRLLARHDIAYSLMAWT